jgi:hypothetical protein
LLDERIPELLGEEKELILDDLVVSGKAGFSYVSRILRLSHLSPKILQAILNGKQPA